MMTGEAEGKGWRGPAVADGVGEMTGADRPGEQVKGRRPGELWGERATGAAGGDGDGSSRHVYLGDMGNAGAQRTLQSIAEDVQVLRPLWGDFFHVWGLSEAVFGASVSH